MMCRTPPPPPPVRGTGHSHMIMSETLVVSGRGGISDFGLTKGVEDEKPYRYPFS